MKYKFIGIVITSLLLTGCLNLEDPKVFVEAYEDEIVDVLEADPYKVCNEFSKNSSILINAPCQNDSININRIRLDGSTLESTIKLKLEVYKNDEIIFEDEITPVPDTAASSTKLISHTFSLDNDSLGQIKLVISNDFDEVTLNLRALQ
jgi:hypothetical protein